MMPQLSDVNGTAAMTIPVLAKKSDREMRVSFISGSVLVTAGVPGKIFRLTQTPPLRTSSIINVIANTNFVTKVMKKATSTIERTARRRSKYTVPIIPINKSAEYDHHRMVNVRVFAHLILVVLNAL